MTKLLPIERQCLGKEGHVTRSVAQAHKKALGYAGMDTYRCQWCGFWHIGHSRRRPRPQQQDWRGGKRGWRAWASEL